MNGYEFVATLFLVWALSEMLRVFTYILLSKEEWSWREFCGNLLIACLSAGYLTGMLAISLMGWIWTISFFITGAVVIYTSDKKGRLEQSGKRPYILPGLNNLIYLIFVLVLGPVGLYIWMTRPKEQWLRWSSF
jgi:hypothetical protein